MPNPGALNSEAPKRRILALDGGGVRGIISIAFVERIEKIHQAGRAQDSSPVPLARAFDLIGGTSTGAIIGTCLALGLSAKEIGEFYLQFGSRIFQRSRWRISGLQSRFDAVALRQELSRFIGTRPLESPDLLTGLALLLKRIDTDSTWIVTNNPKSRYWNDPPDGSYVGNRHFALASLVRASTAAPFFFVPEEIAIVAGQAPGLFVDGGISMHNNPALALLQTATVPAYGYGWPVGREHLQIVSVGTGAFRQRLDPKAARGMTAAGFAARALVTMISDGQAQVLTMMQLLGHTDTPWTVNSEVGDLKGARLPPEPLFTFQRYDVRLERDWLRQELGIDLREEQVARLRLMDAPENMTLAYEIGQAAAEKFVRAEHFGK